MLRKSRQRRLRQIQPGSGGAKHSYMVTSIGGKGETPPESLRGWLGSERNRIDQNEQLTQADLGVGTYAALALFRPLDGANAGGSNDAFVAKYDAAGNL